MRHFALPHLEFLICSIWLCRKLLCFTYLLATGSGAYHFRQRQSRNRRRKLHPPEAKGQHCGELASRLSSRLTFAYLCVVVRANLTVNMPLRILVGVHRVFPLTQLYRKCWISIKIEDGLRRSSSCAPSGSIVKVEYQWVTKTTNRFTNLNSKKCKKVKFSTFTQHFESYYDLSLLSCLN